MVRTSRTPSSIASRAKSNFDLLKKKLEISPSRARFAELLLELNNLQNACAVDFENIGEISGWSENATDNQLPFQNMLSALKLPGKDKLIWGTFNSFLDLSTYLVENEKISASDLVEELVLLIGTIKVFTKVVSNTLVLEDITNFQKQRTKINEHLRTLENNQKITGSKAYRDRLRMWGKISDQLFLLSGLIMITAIMAAVVVLGVTGGTGLPISLALIGFGTSLFFGGLGGAVYGSHLSKSADLIPDSNELSSAKVQAMVVNVGIFNTLEENKKSNEIPQKSPIPSKD